MKIYSLTDVGLVRDGNQDSYQTEMLSDDTAFCVVCDGMGGANAGNIASQQAVQFITDYVKRSYREGMDADAASDLLKNAIASANIRLYDLSLKSENLNGMGTTAVAVLVGSDFLAVAHVGDSRAYLVGEDLRQLTRDHSMVQHLIETGELTPEEAKVHPQKNVITRALGTEEDVLVDTAVFERIAGECLLLCSDGLSNFVEPEDICSVLQETEPEKAPERLIEIANGNGGGDNITAVTVLL